VFVFCFSRVSPGSPFLSFFQVFDGFVHLGFCLGGGFFGMNVFSWFLVCFSWFSVLVVFGRGLCGESREFSGEYAGLMIVGEFLVFREALMLKTGGGWRVWLKSSCFPSFWFTGKGFRGCGKEFDGSGKSGLWKKSVRVKECCRLKVAVSRGCWEGLGTLFPIDY
jgi:hypothetical protein